MSNNDVMSGFDGKYEYCLTFSGLGGESVVGTVSDEFATYWNELGKYRLRDYIFTDEEDRPQIAKVGAMEGSWTDVSNLVHANGPWMNVTSLSVFDMAANDYILRYDETFDVVERFNRETTIDFRSKKLRRSTNMLKLRSSEYHTIDYLLTTDKPFDATKLIVSDCKVDGLSYLDKVAYNDNEIDWDRWDVQWNSNSADLILKKTA